MLHDPNLTRAARPAPTPPSPTPPSHRPRAPRRPWAQLLNALLKLAGNHGELLHHCEQNWASVTFAGTRHSLALRFAGAEALAAGERFIALLPDHEFALTGQLVADAQVICVNQETLPQPLLVVEVELLLLEDR